jgi:hypothetical protein
VHPRTLASLQPRSRVALGLARRALDLAKAMQPMHFALGLPRFTDCIRQVRQARQQLVAFGADLTQLLAKSVALGQHGGELFTQHYCADG